MKRMKRWHPVLVVVGVVGLAALAGLFLYLLVPNTVLPLHGDVYLEHQQSDATLLDRHGSILHELRVNDQVRRLEWTGLEHISPAFRRAMVFAEDRRFFEHNGVDWRAIGSAIVHLATRSGIRGASTISMQLVSAFTPQLRPKLRRRSWRQKLWQIRAAGALEKQWSKSEILEAYMNLVYFRGELQGIAAAAKGLFGKQPHGLSLSESVILASLVRSPNASLDKVVSRAEHLAQTMGRRIEQSEIYKDAERGLSNPPRIQPIRSLAPHVARMLLLQNMPSLASSARVRVASTLDAATQEHAIETLQKHLRAARERHMQDGAILVADNASGDILAYVGNAGSLSSARHVDGVVARRQAGSTLKPFLYGLAFEGRVLTAASLINDVPLNVPLLHGVYRPANYDNHFRGLVTSRTALASSLNIPAVRVLQMIGVDDFVDLLVQLGFRDLREPDYYGPSLALGSADVRLWDLVNAYRTLANGGRWSPLRMDFSQDSRPSGRSDLSREVAFILSDILSDREGRAETFGLESPLATRYWTAVKTGTSKDMRDNWCLGFSERYTVGVWVGNFSGEPMHNVSGMTGAAPVWLEIMNWLHRHSSSRRPQPPAGLVATTIRIFGNPRPRSYREWFLPGTETVTVRPSSVRPTAQISYPTEGMIVALDPDIPKPQQKILFESRHAANGLRWVLNGRAVGNASSRRLWHPTAGSHTLSLVDRENHIADSVSFSVRGED